MGPVDWDKNLLAPLQGVFGESVEYRPRHGAPFDITGIFDRAYTVDVEPVDDNGPTVNTTRPVLGVRDSAFFLHQPPEQGDMLYIPRVKTLFKVADVQPDSHGGSRLELNKVKEVL